MRSSLILLSAAASMALAGPLDKRVLEVVTEFEVVYYTVTEEATTSTSAPAVATPHLDFQRPNKHLKSTTDSAVVTPVVVETPVVTVEVTVYPDAPAPEVPATTAPTTTEVPVVTVTETPVVETPAAAVVEVPATTSAAAAVVAAPSDLASTAVYHHNIHRANHSAPDVTWGDTYASYAATVAATCVFAHDLTPGGGGYGQNIAMWASSSDAESLGAEKAIAQAITNMWYDGELDLYPSASYGLANPDFTDFEGWGHYSQVVWVGSTVIGCDAHYCAPGTMEPDMGAWYSVCNYYPAGNMGGEYGDNVLKPLGQAIVIA